MKEEQELLEADAGSGSMRQHGSNMRLSRGDLADSSADNEAQVKIIISKHEVVQKNYFKNYHNIKKAACLKNIIVSSHLMHSPNIVFMSRYHNG